MRSLSILSLFVALLMILGCGKSGPEVYQVEGTVTYLGKPLPTGSVMFVPEDRHTKPAVSAIDANGHYQLKTIAGAHKIQVQMVGRLRGQGPAVGEGSKLDIPEVDWLIPKKYSQFQTSGLTEIVEVKKANSIDLPLQ